MIEQSMDPDYLEPTGGDDSGFVDVTDIESGGESVIPRRIYSFETSVIRQTP